MCPAIILGCFVIKDDPWRLRWTWARRCHRDMAAGMRIFWVNVVVEGGGYLYLIKERTDEHEN